MTVTIVIEAEDDFQIVTADETFVPVETTKSISFTRVLSVASSSQVITGIGFMPRLVLFQAAVYNTVWASFGQASSTSQTYLESYIGVGNYPFPTAAGIVRDGAAAYQTFTVASFDDDGFTLAWLRYGSPTATATINANCFR